MAEQTRLPELVTEAVCITGADNSGGANPAAKMMTLMAAMAAGADSSDGVDRARHTAMPAVFDGIRAPSTWWRSHADAGPVVFRRQLPCGCPSISVTVVR
ncbi:hypothetical protein [Saccharopolyspora sp. NPDC002376]